MNELTSGNNLRGLMAEFIATFTFVFMGIGAVGAAIGAGLSLADPFDTAGLIVISLGHGVGIFVGIIVFGRVTGAHLNPAVTIAAIVSGNIGILRGFTYIVGQLAGATLAAFLIDKFAWPIPNLGVHGPSIAVGDALVIEVIVSFFLVFTIFATAIDKRGNAMLAPLAIALVVFVDHLIAVPLTGASMNPARSFGPALVGGYWADHWIYWVGPIVGGITAAIAYVMIFGEKADKDKFGTLSLGSD
ncbi:MAG: aquaporin [Chloroflexi bacterium]|jgi:MIP family channel proteins|nr:aquaporin [Chloroflexota bacterium]MBT5627396.1 aquaporin [Chloroflexota bacterium]